MPRWRWISGTSAAKPPRFAPDENVVSCEEVSTTHARLLVVARRLERRDQLRQQLVRERVAVVRLVQRDRRDVVLHVVEQRLEVGQGVSPRIAGSRKSYCLLWPGCLVALRGRAVKPAPTDRRLFTMATAATEIKPDFSAPKRHFCITDEHEQLRESIESFCRARAGPPLRRVGGERLPRLGVQADGRAGLPRRLLPGGVRRPGRRLLHVADARRGDGALEQRRPRDGHRGPHRHGDAADPQVRLRVPQADLPRARRSRAR